MDPLTGAVLGFGGLKAGFGLVQAGKQRDEERAAVREQVRRMRAQNAQVLGQARAEGAADEFGLSGSLPAYLQSMAAEMEREVQWAKRSGMRSADLGFQAGLFGAATDFGGSILKAGDMNRWWLGSPSASGASSLPPLFATPNTGSPGLPSIDAPSFGIDEWWQRFRAEQDATRRARQVTYLEGLLKRLDIK